MPVGIVGFSNSRACYPICKRPGVLSNSAITRPRLDGFPATVHH